MLVETLLERRTRLLEVAARAKAAEDITLPLLPDWNYAPCRRHAPNLDPACKYQECGIHPRKHQRKGAVWMYVIEKGLLADSVGTGKTAQLNTVTALRRMRGELGPQARTVIVCKPQALDQWIHQTTVRMLPFVPTMAAIGTPQERIARYMGEWEICIISYTMLNNDLQRLLNFPIAHVMVDDVDALRHPDTKTAYSIKRLARDAQTFLVATGTPLQKRLHELHSVLEPMGAKAVFGDDRAFKARYIRTEKQTIYRGRQHKKIIVNKVVGYKNVDEFIRLVEPFALRRTAADIDDVTLPTIIPNNVYLELYPEQRAAYQELRRGVLIEIGAMGPRVKQSSAMAKMHHGAKICGGMASLGHPDGPETSVKFDWIMDKLDEGDLSDDKVVMFINYKDTIRNIAIPRLKAAGIDYEIIWGDEPSREERTRSMNRFWQDDNCRVLIGTMAIEQSLNLQCARHLINVDTILNPARMEQLTGRIRRDGSAFQHVYVHNLYCTNTQEAGYPLLLEREQAVIDYVWQENSELFESLNPLALMQLIVA